MQPLVSMETMLPGLDKPSKTEGAKFSALVGSSHTSASQDRDPHSLQRQHPVTQELNFFVTQQVLYNEGINLIFFNLDSMAAEERILFHGPLRNLQTLSIYPEMLEATVQHHYFIFSPHIVKSVMCKVTTIYCSFTLVPYNR